MKIISLPFIFLVVVSPPVFAQLDGGLNQIRQTPPQCSIDANFRARNPQLCDSRSQAQRMADEKRKLVKEFKNSATQFKVDCPEQMQVKMTATPPQGFNVINSGGSAQTVLWRVNVDGSRLDCQYMLPAATLGTPTNLGLRYEYSAAGKQCGPSVYPCEDRRCSMVCDK